MNGTAAAVPMRAPRVLGSEAAISRLALGALVLLVAAGVALLIGDFGVRLANSTGDDSPVLFARFLLDPQPWHGDILETFAAFYGLGTFVHWGPTLLLRFFDLSPEASSLVLTYAQSVLLALAMWALARAVGFSRSEAWVAAVFTLSAEVYLWNLANYRGQMQIPYAGHLVMPFIVVAAATLLNGRFGWSAASLMCASLIHPTLTLLTLPPLAFLILFQSRTGGTPSNIRSALLRAIALAGPPFAIAAAIALFLRASFPGTMSDEQVLDAMRLNPHMNTFGLGHFWSSMVPAYGGFVALLGLALRRMALQPAYRMVLLASLACALFYTVLHAVALRFGIITFITLVPSRFTMVLVMLAMPAIAALLVRALASGTPAERFAAGALLVLHSLSTLALFWPAIAALVLGGERRENEPEQRARIRQTLASSLLIAWALAAAALSIPAVAASPFARVASLLVAGGVLDSTEMLIGLTLAGAMCAIPMVGSRSRRGSTESQRGHVAVQTAMLVVAGLLLVRSAAKGNFATQGDMRDLYDAQLWANEHTSEDAIFIVEAMVPWRVISQRRMVTPFPSDAFVYTRSRAAFEHKLAVREQVTRRPFREEADVLDFRGRFSGDYLVRWSERPALFTPVYRNSTFAIYRLPPAARGINP